MKKTIKSDDTVAFEKINAEIKDFSYEEKLNYWDKNGLDWRQVGIVNTIQVMNAENKQIFEIEPLINQKNLCGKWVLNHFIEENQIYDVGKVLDQHKLKIEGNPKAKSYIEKELLLIKERKKRFENEEGRLKDTYYKWGFESVIENQLIFRDISISEFMGHLPSYCAGIVDAHSEEFLKNYQSILDKGPSNPSQLRFQGHKIEICELIYVLSHSKMIYKDKDPITCKELTKIFENLLNIKLGNILDDLGKAKGTYKRTIDRKHFIADLHSTLNFYYEITT